MSEYLSKEEIKKWRSSVEKITLEEYAARLGKKLQEEKKTNDLADMLYTRFNPAQTPENYDTVTKLEKIDLTPKTTTTKPKKASKIAEDIEAFDINEEDLMLDETEDMESETEKPVLKEQTLKPIKETPVAEKKTTTAKKEVSKKEAPSKEKKNTAVKKEKQPIVNEAFAGLNITFKKPLTDREEKVLAHFVEKRGEIVYAKDLAELLDLKRDYIYKYIKNLRAKMSTDIIANADNGGFKLD